jgi:hypothetical protein
MYGCKSIILAIATICSVVCWRPRSHNPTTIHEKPVIRFHEKALAYSSVMNWFRCLHFAEDIFEPGSQTGKATEGKIDVCRVIDNLNCISNLPFGNDSWQLIY